MEGRVDPAALLAALPDIIFVLGVELDLQYISAGAAQVLGWEPAEWIGRSAADILHPDDLALAASSMGAVQGKPMGTPIEVRVRNATGGWQWLEVVGADHLGRPGVDGIVCVARDLTRRRMWEVAGGDVARFQQVVQHAASITLLLDVDGMVRAVNGAFTRLLHHDPTNVIGRSLAAFADEASSIALEGALATCIATGRRVSVEAMMRLAESPGPGEGSLPVHFELVNLLDDPVVAGLVVTGHDVSELYVARQELERLARHDSLTGLPNRAVALQHLDHLLHLQAPVGVVFVDLDRFKPVNDRFGHEAGDELLQAVAARLTSSVRSSDVVARIGGDEFVVIASGIADRAAAEAMVRHLEQVLTEPFTLTAGSVQIGASLGVAIAEPGSTVVGLMADADQAMYSTKAARTEPARPDGSGTAPAPHRRAGGHRSLVEQLELGLEQREIMAYLQPIVDLDSGRTVAVEALARWHHAELGLLTPARFVGVAVTAGLDLALGDVVLRSACETIRRSGLVGGDVQLCLNLSVGELSHRALTRRVSDVLARAGIPGRQLVVEITEDALAGVSAGTDGANVDDTLRRLRAMGASLSLDNFGTGPSSLNHLRTLPLSQVKIDRALVCGLLHDAHDRAAIAAIVGLADELHLRVVAEGVESAEQLDALRALGCHAAQGFHVAVPMPPDEAVAWLRGIRLGTEAGPPPSDQPAPRPPLLHVVTDR